MSFYLDTNVIVAFLTADALSERAEAFLVANPAPLIVSNFAAVEFSAVIARQVRTKERPRDEASPVFAEFDAWCEQSTSRVELDADHVAVADRYLRRLDLALLAPDAIHIAIAQSMGATLVTFDRRMATAARMLGIAIAVA